MTTFNANRFDFQGNTLRANIDDLGVDISTLLNAGYLRDGSVFRGMTVMFDKIARTFRFRDFLRNGDNELMGWHFRSSDGFDVFVYADGDC
jgi:hypothetical protein